MTLIKTSLLSAISTLVRILSGFIITKIISVYVGPSGLALIGQLQNFINIVLLASGNFLKTAITKYTAEYHTDSNKKYELWSSAVQVTLGLNLVFLVILLVFSDQIAEYLFQSTKYAYILKILAISMPFFILNTLLLSILNGQKQIKDYIVLNIILSLFSLLIITTLTVIYDLDGALIAYVTNQSVVFVITVVYLKDQPWLKLKNFIYKIKTENIQKLFAFAMITLAAVIASNLSMIYVRDYITNSLSLESAGYWQGVWLLSQIILSFITTSLATYFLPKLSELHDKKAIAQELFKASYIIVPIAVCIALGIYYFRDMIILILYSKTFLPMNELFLWQMVGTVVKVLGWLFGYVLVAKAMVKYTVSTEILFAITFVLLSIYCISYYGLIGVTYAFAINSFFHCITMCTIFILMDNRRL